MLLHLLSLHECKFAIYILNGNGTQNDNRFLSQVEALTLNSNVSMMVQESNIDFSYETNDFSKACIVSSSESVLNQSQLTNRWKRPVKILLGSLYSIENPKPDYEPVIVESPPVVSIFSASLSSSMFDMLLIPWP